MVAGSSSNASAIETTDALVRSLYRRLNTGSGHTDFAISLRTLHTVLKELRTEAGQPDSLVNNSSPSYSAVYASQLPPLLEDCDSTLKQLNAHVQDGLSAQSPSPGADHVRRSAGTHLDHAKIDDHVASLRSYLERAGPQKSRSDPGSLAAPDLSSPQSRSMSPMPPEDERLETIKSRVDAIARRLSHQDLLPETLSTAPSSDALWRVFNDELLYEGFSGVAISQNEAPLQSYVEEAYFRFVPQERAMPMPQQPPPYTISSPEPAAVLPPVMPGESCPKEALQPPEKNDKYMVSIKHGRTENREPIPIPLHIEPQLPAELPSQEQLQQQQQQHRHELEQQLVFSPTAMAARLSPARSSHMHYASASSSSSPTMGGYTPASSSDDDPDGDPSFDYRLISTSKLLAIDWHAREAYATRAGVSYRSPMLLQQAASFGPETSTALVPSPVQGISLPARPASSHHLQPVQPGPVLSSSAPQTSSAQSSVFGVMIPARNSAPHGLAPDSRGNVIPPDAIWTKINRRLVSPEVLEKAGVRYEARPTFVAVLGVLSRADIAEYARQSAKARKARLMSNRRQSWTRNGPPAHGHASSESAPRSRDSTKVYRTQSTPIVSQESKPVPATTINKAKTFPAGGGSRPAGRDEPHSPTSDDGPAYVVGSAEPYTAGNGRGNHKTYPFIVSPPATASDAEPRSPQGTIRPDLLPRSILKNKNTNQVRVKDGKTVEVSPDGTTSSHEQGHSRARDRSRHRGHGHHHSHSERDRHHDRGEQHEKSRRRHEDRSRTHDGHKESERDRDRDRNRRDHDRQHERNKSRDRNNDHGRDRDRDRDRNRSRDRDRSRGPSPQRTILDLFSRDYRETREGRSRLRDTIGAASIGGAAGSILTALTEAASGL